MPDFLDMGKYSFYVWSSVALFFILIGWDMFSLQRKQKSLCRQLLAMQRRQKHRRRSHRNQPLE